MSYKTRRMLTIIVCVAVIVVAAAVGAFAAMSLVRGQQGADSTNNQNSADAGDDTDSNNSNSGNSSGGSDSGSSDDGSGSGSSSATATAERLDTTNLFTNRDKEIGYDESECILITLADGASTCDSGAVSISGDTITIAQEGTYILRGSLTDGQVQVNVSNSDKVQLVLDGASITNASSAAIYVKQADKVFVTLADDSSNTLAVTGEFVAIDDNNIDGAIFSKSDLTLNGNGTLTVDCAEGHGIVSKDDLIITSGTYVITAGGNGLSGQDSVRIADGNFTITADNDGIHSENEDDATRGYIYIADGNFTITANNLNGSEGLDASYIIQLDGGTFDIKSTVGKGIKGTVGLFFAGAEVNVDAWDDGIHSNGEITIDSGSYTITAGDDGVHADDELTINGGTVTVTKSYEGLESEVITIGGGTISVTSSDDGINAAGGKDSSGFSNGMGAGRDMFGGNTTGTLEINGGTIVVNASGDGIDSNGTFTMNDGTLYVTGPTSNGDAAVDWETSGIINGGVLIAAGSTGMQESLSSSSAQCSILVNASGSSGDTVSLSDADGNVLASYTPQRNYACVLISCPEITSDGSYTVTCGSTETSVQMSGTVYSGGGMSGGMGGGMGNTPGGDMGGGNGGGMGRR